MSEAIRALLLGIVNIIMFAVFGRVIISWLLVAGMRNELILRLDQTLSVVTDPIMRPLRRVIPPFGGMIDITPMVAIIILIVLQRAISSF